MARSTKNPFAILGLSGSRSMSLRAANIVAANRWRTSAPLSFHGPIHRPVPRLPACPDQVPVITSGVRVGVRVSRRNRQDLNGRNTRVRSPHNSVNQKIIKFGHFATVGAVVRKNSIRRFSAQCNALLHSGRLAVEITIRQRHLREIGDYGNTGSDVTYEWM
jgi:hypothetical protein